ncbi:MAG: FG-GAP-like repeat-containing protein, partial [Blastocatellia bacterium]|nr:FG-GAP-like repeat-containing protein [Blastocatellia bacterium]
MNNRRKPHTNLAMGLALAITLNGLIWYLPNTIHSANSSSVTSGRITMRPEHRGNPHINLSDGREMFVEYVGDHQAVKALEHNQARPLALASADFDEDGVPDLIGSYGAGGGGIIALYHGNVDSIYPNSPEAKRRKAEGTFTDWPFLPQVRAFSISLPADFIGAGDFDADGHQDVVAATRGGNRLALIKGTGWGSFDSETFIDLQGSVTALTVGEINRADGLADVIVGIQGTTGPHALVFESSKGALRAEPEIIEMPHEVTALALGQLGADYTMDLAVAAGKELLLVYGRDRKLSQSGRAEASTPRISTRSFDFYLNSVAIGDFRANSAGDISENPSDFMAAMGGEILPPVVEPDLTGIRKNSKASDARRSGNETHSVEADQIAILANDGSIYVLSEESLSKTEATIADDWAMERLSSGHAGRKVSRKVGMISARVSSHPADDLILIDPANERMNIVVVDTGSGQSLTSSNDRKPMESESLSLAVDSGPVAALPMRLNSDALSDVVIMRNGHSQISVTLTQAQATFTVTNTNDSGPGSLRQAIIDANRNPGLDTIIFSIGSGPVTITIAANTPNLVTSDAVTIDGTTQPGFSGTPIIELNGTNNYLVIDGGNSVVRGLVNNRFNAFTSLYISSNGNNVIEGNFIGTNATGTSDVGNSTWGVIALIGANGNIIGGTTAAARNIIAGNSAGVGIFTTNNLISGNYIGTDITGTISIANGSGIVFGNSDDLSPASNNIIGGATPLAGNLIAGNGAGITLTGTEASNNQIQGNLIGIQADGASPLGNTAGIIISKNASHNTVGGENGAGNVIAFNSGGGVFVSSGDDNKIRGNSIFSNAGLGIDLGTVGVTGNDPDDGDLGANGLQNYPELSTVTQTEGLKIRGTLRSSPNILRAGVPVTAKPGGSDPA